MKIFEIAKMLYYMVLELVAIYPIVAAVLIGLPIIALLSVLFGGQKNWSVAKKPALILSLIAGGAAFFGLPPLFKSSLSEMSYYVDWLFHISYVLAAMIYVFFVVWFLLAPRVGRG